jgi:hypothetical protein
LKSQRGKDRERLARTDRFQASGTPPFFYHGPRT